MFYLIWARTTQDPASQFTLACQQLFDADTEHWRGVLETDRHVWFGASDTIDNALLMKQATTSGITLINIRTLTDRRNWMTGVIQDAPVANFVMREVQSDAMPGLLPAIHSQIEVVADHPGCLGCSLLVELQAPHHLLGITYWQSEEAFRQYAVWAGAHPWKDTITPVTQNVPIRLLTERVR